MGLTLFYLALVIVGCAGLVGAWLLAFERGRASASPQVEWLQKELAQANDRLYNVSLNPAALIPPRDADAPAEEFRQLEPELETIVGEWEDGLAADIVRKQFHRWRDEGVSVSECVRRHLNA